MVSGLALFVDYLCAPQAKLLSQFYAISNWAEAVPEGAFLWEAIYPKLSEKEGGTCRRVRGCVGRAGESVICQMIIHGHLHPPGITRTASISCACT